MSKSQIRIAIIIGSVRRGNYTKKAVRLVEDELASMADVSVDLIDPAEFALPLPGNDEPLDPGLDAMRTVVSAAAGILFATPEYHGSYSSVTKLIVDNLNFPSALSGKPIVLLGVAAGSIGAIKALEHLRSVCSHVGGTVLPTSVSIANVRDVFDAEGNCLDPSTERRIRSLPHKLVDYVNQVACPAECMEQVARDAR